MDQRIIDLYDEFVHVHFDRRLFLERTSKIAGGSAAAVALLPLLQSNYALAAMVAENDPAISAERMTFKGATGDVKAYLAKPKGAGKHGAVIVVHQNRGLNGHIEDIARRLAKQGYVAMAVDFLSPMGGTPANEDAAMKMFETVDMKGVRGNVVAAANYMRSRDDTNGKVGIVGFCWGGGVVNTLAVADPKLNAASVFYGVPPDAKEVPNIKAALLLNYADPKLDPRLGKMVPAYRAELDKAHIPYEFHFYEGANHAFNDDTNQARYNKDAATQAWNRTLDLFKKNLS